MLEGPKGPTGPNLEFSTLGPIGPYFGPQKALEAQYQDTKQRHAFICFLGSVAVGLGLRGVRVYLCTVHPWRCRPGTCKFLLARAWAAQGSQIGSQIGLLGPVGPYGV